MKNLILIVSMLLLVLFSCKKDDDDNEPASNLPFPAPTSSIPIDFVKVGNSWTYELEDFYGNKATQVVTISSQVQNGVYKVKNERDGVEEDMYWYIDGNLLKAWDGDGGSIRYKQNAKIGDTWSYSNSSNNVETEVLSVDTVIFVDGIGKSFKTHQYYLSLLNKLNDQTDYWSPDTGLVYSDAGGWFTLTLVDATLK
ncbi:MAG: hypothetical protein WD077_14560 [Bacteroidia bacterium]